MAAHGGIQFGQRKPRRRTWRYRAGPGRDEVGLLGEAVHHRENLRFAADLGESFNKIHGGVDPDDVWNVQRL